jgi:hypothetical protein
MAYGSAANLNWLVNEKQIAPHIPVIDKSKRDDGTFSREDFTFDKWRNVYICPAFKTLTTTGKIVNDDHARRDLIGAPEFGGSLRACCATDLRMACAASEELSHSHQCRATA